MKKIMLISFILLMLGCNFISGGNEYKQNLEKWQAQDISSYRFELRVSCFCPYMDQMPVTVKVVDGEVTSVLDSSGNPASEELLSFLEPYLTIEQVFGRLKSALKEADQVEVEYDPMYGIPSSISIDYIEQAVDDEMGIYISNFEVIDG